MVRISRLTAVLREMEPMTRMVHALPPGALPFIMGAILFGLGALNASLHGLRELSQFGLVGAIVALGVAYGFCDWRRPPGLGRS